MVNKNNLLCLVFTMLLNLTNVGCCSYNQDSRERYIIIAIDSDLLSIKGGHGYTSFMISKISELNDSVNPRALKNNVRNYYFDNGFKIISDEFYQAESCCKHGDLFKAFTHDTDYLLDLSSNEKYVSEVLNNIYSMGTVIERTKGDRKYILGMIEASAEFCECYPMGSNSSLYGYSSKVKYIFIKKIKDICKPSPASKKRTVYLLDSFMKTLED